VSTGEKVKHTPLENELIYALTQAIGYLVSPDAWDKDGLLQDWRQLRRKAEGL